MAVVLDLGAAGVRFAWSPIDFRWPQPSPGLTVGVLLAVAVGYLAAGWAMAGRTYGDRLLGLRVLSTRRELLGWARSVLRAAVCVLWPIGLLWCAVDRRRASVADLVVRSVVVYDTHPYAQVPHLRPAGADRPADAAAPVTPCRAMMPAPRRRRDGRAAGREPGDDVDDLRVQGGRAADRPGARGVLRHDHRGAARRCRAWSAR